MQSLNKLIFRCFSIRLLLMGGLIVLIAGSSLAQSGWAKEKDEVFAKLSYSYFQSDMYFNLLGGELKTSEFQQQAVSLYGEYGLTKSITLLMDWPAFKLQGFETTESVGGVGDLKLGVKYALPIKLPVTISIIPEFPIAQANKFAQNKANSMDNANLPTGDGEFNIYSILAVSHSFYPFPCQAAQFF